MMSVIYLDNAATSFPKPDGVIQAMVERLSLGGNAGRGHHSLAAGADHLIRTTRAALASFLGAESPGRIVFSLNATDALNMAIKGTLCRGDHAVSTVLEHNSVLRPLQGLAAREGVAVDYAPVSSSGILDPREIETRIRPNTKLVVVTHVSNVLGTIQPIARIAEICSKHGVRLLVDAAQSTGKIPINVRELGVDMLAFSAHKGLLGPQGLGGLYVKEGLDLRPWREGGTGTASEAADHPRTMPEALEAGTQNLPAIAGLRAALDFLDTVGVDQVHAHVTRLTGLLIEALHAIPGVTIFGDLAQENRCGALSFNIAGVPCAEVGMILDQSFGISVRTGLHCAARIHQVLGTEPEGTVRVSAGWFTTEDEIQSAIEAISAIATSISG